MACSGSIWVVIFSGVIALACSSGDEASGPGVVREADLNGAISCQGNFDCKNTTTAPVCGDTGATYCNTVFSSGTCVYRLLNLGTCVCVEHTIQYCVSGGTGGTPMIQDCIATGGSATSWGGCHHT